MNPKSINSATLKRNASPSNNSDSSSKEKKQKKSSGVSWGSNFASASKAASRSSPFANFGTYMEEKNRKLRSQYNANASSLSASDGGLFGGVSIFVDGYTVPSSQELRAYMLKYGGGFENYFSRRRVTHIVCSNLTHSKIKNIRSFSRGLPVVKPGWLLDSIAANRLLDWVPYQLDQLVDKTPNQKKLSSFFSVKSRPSGVGPEQLKSGPLLGEALPFIVGSDVKTPALEEPVILRSLDDSVQENDIDTEKESHLIFDDTSENISGFLVNNEKREEQDTSNLGSSSHHSTLTDPDFVHNYFKCSRLHFIGTWRSRYLKRFGGLSTAVCAGSLELSSDSTSNNQTFMHVDMDCFFVSVVIRNSPELHDKPVAVCHSDNPKGTAEISSANYPARKYGVRAGMFVRDAKSLCPQLLIKPYDFGAYEEVAEKFYEVLHKHCNKIQAVSCDEAVMDISYLEEKNPEDMALIIRQEIVDATGCTASVGIASNILMARLATSSAKPNGQCHILEEKVEEFLFNLPPRSLPGIGCAIAEKLDAQNIQTCGQLREVSKEALQNDFGTKTGEMLWNFSRGIDKQHIHMVQEMKSVGAEVNWGVRFNNTNDCQHFLECLCKEVILRLQGCGMRGRTITLKVKKRKKGAGEPVKFMGCGDCDNLSRSVTVAVAMDNVDILSRNCKQIFASFCLDVKEVRGIGIHISKLEPADVGGQGYGQNRLESWLCSSESKSQSENVDCTKMKCITGSSVKGESRKLDVQGVGVRNCGDNLEVGAFGTVCPRGSVSSTDVRNNMSDMTLPPLSQLDLSVVRSLPHEIICEFNKLYNGGLLPIIGDEDLSGEKEHAAALEALPKAEDGTMLDLHSNLDRSAEGLGGNEFFNREGKQPVSAIEPHGENDCDVASTLFSPKLLQADGVIVIKELVDVMPDSLSQVDISVLKQLPLKLQHDILDLLPAHRNLENNATKISDAECMVSEALDSVCAVKELGCSGTELWMGKPPMWLHMFKESGSLLLCILAEHYDDPSSDGLLSSTLQLAISSLQLDNVCSDWCDALQHLYELIRQYIKLKIETNVEEIHLCFRLLKRWTKKSAFFLQLYEDLVPFLQTSATELYGGSLVI